MMRARLLKPTFFRDVALVRLSALTRLVFAGLWCMADRDGRLKDEPDQIRIDILPLDHLADVDAMLGELAAGDFIQRYEVDGKRYIQVRSFAKHQTPHVREPASTIPAPCQPSASTSQAPDEHDAGPAVYGIRYLDPESVAKDQELATGEYPASPNGDGHLHLAKPLAVVVANNGHARHKRPVEAIEPPDAVLAVAGDETDRAPPWPDIGWIDDAFEHTFWQVYPRKTHKAEARTAFRARMRKHQTFQAAYDDLAHLLEVIVEQAQHWTDPQFTPHPATYLRGERDQDEIIVPTGGSRRRR